MMLCGLTLVDSTIRSRIWPSERRAPTPFRSGARSPWAPVSDAGIESAARAFPARSENAIAQASHQFNAVVLQRHRADTPSGRLGEGVQHRRRGDADRRLADAAPHR